jgi:ABC-type antimicrobial peptide transport system permease subunit
MGVRIAVGATRANVIWLVMREVGIFCAIGLSVGVLLALASTKLIASLLYDLSPNDPAMIALAVGILGGVAMTAGYLPARRAALTDPMQALRSD